MEASLPDHSPALVSEGSPTDAAAASSQNPAASEVAAAEAVATEGGTEYTGIGEATETASINVDGTQILLYGLESEYPPQSCTIRGQSWDCWAAAVRQLQTLLAEGPVTCRQTSQRDIFGRVLAICFQGGQSLNARYVRSGFALAIENEMPAYAALEAEARDAGVGLWQGQFQEPEQYRQEHGIMQLRP